MIAGVLVTGVFVTAEGRLQADNRLTNAKHVMSVLKNLFIIFYPFESLGKSPHDVSIVIETVEKQIKVIIRDKTAPSVLVVCLISNLT